MKSIRDSFGQGRATQVVVEKCGRRAETGMIRKSVGEQLDTCQDSAFAYD